MRDFTKPAAPSMMEASYAPTPPPQPTLEASLPPLPYAPPPVASSVQPERRVNPLPWLLIPLGVLVIAVVAVIGFKSSGSSVSNSNENTNYSQNKNATVSSTPYRNGRLAICMFTPVHVRAEPRLDATIITDISTGQRVWVIKESTNFDTVFVRSLNRSVYTNWSEIEVENSSIHGWVFSGFLQ